MIYMSKFEELKQKIKDNKHKIVLGTITVAGVVYIIVSQNNKNTRLKNQTIRRK